MPKYIILTFGNYLFTHYASSFPLRRTFVICVLSTNIGGNI